MIDWSYWVFGILSGANISDNIGVTELYDIY